MGQSDSICTSLKEIVISSNVKTIAVKAFYDCNSMQNAVILNNVSSIGDNAFGYNSEGLLPDFKIQGYYNSIAEDYAVSNEIPFELYGERDYSEICVGYYKDGDGIVITDCDPDAEEINIPDEIEGLPVIKIQAYAFKNSSAKSVTIPDTVTSVEKGDFINCTSLISVNLPDGVTSIPESCFENCISLTDVSHSDSVTAIGSKAFYGCVSLEEFEIPSSLNSLGTSAFYDCAFLDCPNLKDVVLENINYYNYYGTGKQFGYNTVVDEEGNISYALTEGMTIRGYISSNTQNYAVNNGICYLPTGGLEYTLYEDHAEITNWTYNNYSIVIPSQIGGLAVTVIGNDAFKGLGGLEDIYFPETLKEIGSCAFMDSSARDMTIPGSVEKIGSNAFYNSRFGNCLTSQFVILGDGILYSYNGTADEVTIPGNVKRIGEDAFAYHSEIISISIPERVTEVCGGAFYRCTSLTRIELPDSVENVDTGAFTGCDSLKTVFVGRGIQNIDEFSFIDCNELTAFYGYTETCTENFAKNNGYYFEAFSEESETI